MVECVVNVVVLGTLNEHRKMRQVFQLFFRVARAKVQIQGSFAALRMTTCRGDDSSRRRLVEGDGLIKEYDFLW